MPEAHTAPAAYSVREAVATDAAAIGALADATADGGAVSFRLVEHVPPELRPARPGTRSVGVVAEKPGAGIVGAARMTLGEFRYEGKDRPYALLGSLVVHPDHRRQGIAAALASWRIRRAEDDAGPRVVIVAEIQKGNEGSLANARRWATAFTEPARSVPVPVRGTPPAAADGVTIRDAAPDDLPDVADAIARFCGERNFARLWPEDALAGWLAETLRDEPVNHYRIAVDRSGTPVAGLAVQESGRFASMRLTRMPPAIRVVNAVLRVVPPDGVLRNLAVEHFWVAPGWLDAAIALWEDTRWALRDRGTHLLITLDRRDPVLPALGLRPWTPSTAVVTAVRADAAPSAERLVSPLA